SNAVKFTPSGGSGAITASREADGGVAIVVRDTGIGMDADELAMAMEPFRQVDNAYTRTQGGTGLGLPLTKALVELHGGAFSIDSRKSVGTKITVRLPAWRVEAASGAPQKRVAEG